MVVATELWNCEITCHQHRNETRTPIVSLHAHWTAWCFILRSVLLRNILGQSDTALHRPLHLRSPTDIAHVIVSIFRHSDLNSYRQKIQENSYERRGNTARSFELCGLAVGHRRSVADLSPRNPGLEGQFHVEFVLNKMALRQVCLRACRFCSQYHFTNVLYAYFINLPPMLYRLTYKLAKLAAFVITRLTLPLSSPKLRTRSLVSSDFLLCTKLARTGTRDRAALACDRSEQLKQISRRITPPLCWPDVIRTSQLGDCAETLKLSGFRDEKNPSTQRILDNQSTRDHCTNTYARPHCIKLHILSLLAENYVLR
jgi:hypothetical protein